MFNYLKRRNEDETGFTLIELLVVILIVGVLAAIAVPVFMNQQKAAGDAALKSDLRNAAVAADTWFAERPSATSITGANHATTVRGWAVLSLGSPDAKFLGTVNSPDEARTVSPAGFPLVSVSRGTGLGIVSSNLEGYNRTYCIAGNNVRSNYSVDKTTLLYDSKYGIVNLGKIKADGGCKAYIGL